MEKVYNINVNGRIAMQNVSIEEENATKECLLYMLSDIGANEEEKALKEEIDNGATVEFEEVEEGEKKMKFEVDYYDPETGATSAIDTIEASADYTAEDYIRDCENNADSDWVDMIHAGTITLVAVEE